METLDGAMSGYFSIFKIPSMSCPQLNSKNNGLGMFFKTVLWRLFRFLSFADTDGKDGNRLKLEETWCHLNKKHQKTYGLLFLKTFH